MARIYTVEFANIACAAVQDLVAIYPPTTAANFKQINIIRYWIACSDPTPSATAYLLPVRLKLLTATVSAGSAGNAFTPIPLDKGDAAAQCTARINDTTQATTNGSTIIYDTQSPHFYNGYDSAVQNRPPIPVPCNSAAVTAFIFDLYQNPGASLHLSGGIDFAEAG